MALKLFSKCRSEGGRGCRGPMKVAGDCADVMDGCCRVGTAKEVAAVASGLLLSLDGELCSTSPGFHAVHFLLADGLQSQSGQSLGKLPAASSEEEALAASQVLAIGREVQRAFFWASLSLLCTLGLVGLQTTSQTCRLGGLQCKSSQDSHKQWQCGRAFC